MLGLTTVYSNPALIISSPTNATYISYSASTGVLILPASNMRWDGVSNIVLQICYDMNAGSPGGSDFMYLSTTAPRKSCIWIGSNTITNSGCSLTSLSPGLLSNFGQVPSTLRPNIGFRFRRPQNLMTGLVGGSININGGSKFWSSFANLTVNNDINNSSLLYADTSVINLVGVFNNNGTTDFSFTPLFTNRKTIMNFSGGSWNNNGTFNAGNSLVNFSGALAQNLAGANVTTFHELNINKSATSQTVTLMKDVVVDDTLSLTLGQLLLNANTVSINNWRPVSTGGLLTPRGPISRTGGFIISENASALVKWNTIGTNLGYRVIPFGNAAVASPVYIPFSFQLKGGDIGDVNVSTYNAPGNLPWPPGVTHFNTTTGVVNNAAAAVDRFWTLTKSGANPVADIVFRFTTAERVPGMSTAIAANRGSAQPWRTQLLNGAWIRLQSPYTSLNYTQNYGQLGGPSDSVRVINWDWPILPPQLAQVFPPLYATPGGPIGNSLPWAITINSSPLPVELLRFDASAVDGKVKLFWSTAAEENSDFFTVQRTLDFNTHSEIAKVPSAGYSMSVLDYHAWDENPADGINYYRLLQTDRDGTENVVSDYVPVRFGKSMKFEILSLTHDPTSVLVFNYDSSEDLQLLIFDMTGRLLYNEVGIAAEPGLNMKTLDISSLSQGIYTVQLKNQSSARSFQFMKP